MLTVEDTAAHWKEIAGAHTKNLFFKDAGARLWLVRVLAERHLDLKKLPKMIGSKRLSFASTDLLSEVLGLESGAVSPLAAIRDADRKVTIILDADLLRADVINMHPLANTATIGLAPRELMEFLRRHRHEASVVDLNV